jgi:hypothetical protein
MVSSNTTKYYVYKFKWRALTFAEMQKTLVDKFIKVQTCTGVDFALNAKIC